MSALDLQQSAVADLHAALNRTLTAEQSLDRALAVEEEAGGALDDDELTRIHDHTEQCTAEEGEARRELLAVLHAIDGQLLSRDVAIVHAGHLICRAIEADGLIVLPVERVKYVGYNPPAADPIGGNNGNV